MFLTLTVSAEVWGQTWTRVTTMEQLTSGGTFIMGYEATAKSGTIVPLRSADCNAKTSANGYFHTGTTANSSTNSTITMSSVVNTSAYEVYISSPASGKINIQRATSTGNYYGASSGGSSKNTARLYTEGNTTETNLIVEWASETNNQFKLRTGVSGTYKYLKYNTSSPRFAFYNSAGEKIVFYKKSVPSFTITAQSNNTNYGTVSLSGTTITASPKTGYRVSTTTPYTISPSGSATVTQSENKFTVTPTANCTITINFEAIPKYTVTLVPCSGSVSSTTLIESSAGAGVTLPTPTLDCGDWDFAGWAEESVNAETTTKPTLIPAGAYNPASDITLYAVYQRTETTNGGGNSVSESITIEPNTFPDKGTSSYASGAERTGAVNEISLGGHYITGNQNNTPTGSIAGTYLQCQAKNATIYNKTKLPGNITKVVINQYDAKAFSLYCGSEQLMASNNTSTEQTPSGTKINDVTAATKMTWDVSGDYTYFALKKGSNTGYVTSIVVTYTTSGSGSTIYYHSTPECAAPCTDFVTIRKGTSDNGSFNLDKTGEQSTCNGAVTVTLSDIQPAAGYKFSAITQTDVDASKVTINNTAKTVTYAKNTTGPSTINVTFEQIPRLAKPTNLKVSSVSCANASLTWDAVDGTNKYKLVLTNTSTATPTTSNLNTNSAFITLLAGVTYSWTIQAIGDGTTNTDSEVATGENFTTNYTITYNTNGGSDVEDGCGTTLPETLPTTSKNHYTFDGWYLDEMFTTQAEASATLTKNTDLYAKWTANRYTIRFNAGTGTCGTESATATYADGITLPTATPSDVCDEVGWTFAGWATSSVAETTSAPTLLKANDKYQPTSDITLYAVYSTTAETTGFTGYEKVTEEPDDWSGKYLLSTGTFTATGAFDATGKRGHLVRETHTPGTDEKTAWEFTLAKVDNTGYFILFPDGTWYLGYDDGTNFARSTYDPSLSVAYVWTPSTEGITNVSETTRKIQDGGSDFRPYAQKETIVYLYKRIEGVLSTSTYNSNPDCTPPSEYTITWWANGEEYYTQTAVEGTAIDVPTNSPNAATYACDDKVFVGWVDTEIIGSTDTKPTFITDFDKITENKDFFAVFATEEGGEETTTKVFETGEMGKNGNSITSGYVLIAQASPEEGYYQDGTSADKLYIQVSKVDKSTPMMLSNPSSVVIKANLGGGSTKKLTNPVYAVWLDVNGNEMGNAVIVTDEITNKTGSDFIVSLPVANATEAYGIRVYHQKESGYNVRYYGISLSYTYNTTTYSGYVTTCEKPTYTRVVKPGEYGTICLPYGSSDYTGAEFYEVSSVEYGKGLWLDQLAAGTALAAGKPYIFRATAEKLAVVYKGEKKDSPVDGVNGLTGTFTAIAANSTLVGHFIIAKNQIWVANDKNTLPAYRAYINAEDVPTTAQAQLPGRRRVCMGENAATGLDNITNGENNTIKVIENGQLIIIRNGEKYNIHGQKL